MAGHNKWSKVKHRKGAVDAKRSKVWTKIIREITVASKLGGSDPGINHRLRKAIEDAKINNIAKDTIDRALSKANIDQDAQNFEELTYDGYGPAGVAVLVECLTDNRNRTISEVRTAFNKNGGNLGASGSVSYGFKKMGQIILEKNLPENATLNEDIIIEIGLLHGINEVNEESEIYLISCDFEKLFNLQDALADAGFITSSSSVVMVPDITVPVTGEPARILIKLIEVLEDLDDVQHVWSNEDIPENELNNLMS